MRRTNRCASCASPTACRSSISSRPARSPRASSRPTGSGYGLTAAARRRCRSARWPVLIHIASVWVPFTSESKEAIAAYPEILKEIKLGLQECGRKLGTLHPQGQAAEARVREAHLHREVHPPHRHRAAGDPRSDVTRRATAPSRPSRTCCTRAGSSSSLKASEMDPQSASPPSRELGARRRRTPRHRRRGERSRRSSFLHQPLNPEPSRKTPRPAQRRRSRRSEPRAHQARPPLEHQHHG